MFKGMEKITILKLNGLDMLCSVHVRCTFSILYRSSAQNAWKKKRRGNGKQREKKIVPEEKWDDMWESIRNRV